MTSHNLLQQLHRLDRGSSRFHDRLSDILRGEEYKQCSPSLEGDNLTWFVDYLDKALNCLDPSSPAFQKCLGELRNICGTKAILPTSYILPGSLRGVGSLPFTPGGTGDVYEGTLNGTKVSIKRVRMYSKGDPETSTKTLYQEAVVWKRLNHPNIVPFLGITSTPLQLISEWIPGRRLTEYVKRNLDADRRGLLSDVADGLSHLHSRNVIHGDLKGSSIIVDNTGRARITDFGLATVAQSRDSTESGPDKICTTPRWIAPEILRGDQGSYSKQADIFSFAMVMVEVFTGAVPFSDISAVAATFAIMDGKRPPRPSHPALIDELWALMQRCWDADHLLRPAASEVLKVLYGVDPPAWKRLISYMKRGGSKEGMVGRLARSSRRTFRATTRKFCGL